MECIRLPFGGYVTTYYKIANFVFKLSPSLTTFLFADTCLFLCCMQCILLESLENSSSDKELEPHELDEICSKLRESIESDVRQASVWNTLGLILLRTGRLQVQFVINCLSNGMCI